MLFSLFCRHLFSNVGINHPQQWKKRMLGKEWILLRNLLWVLSLWLDSDQNLPHPSLLPIHQNTSLDPVQNCLRLFDWHLKVGANQIAWNSTEYGPRILPIRTAYCLINKAIPCSHRENTRSAFGGVSRCGASQSNISSNMSKLRCWMKCWIGLLRPEVTRTS